MKVNQVQEKLKMIGSLNADIEYLRGEFNGKLYGSCPDGDVTLEQIIAFAQENEGLLEHICEVAKKIN